MSNSRSLTTGEIALARQVFGNAINYDAVKIHDGSYMPFQPSQSGMTPNNDIYMRDCFQPDYSQGNVDDQAFLIHEMTHVWQYQNKILNPVVEAVKLNLKFKFNYSAAYAFQLDEKKELTNYNMEQQASIVAEYFQRKAYGADVALHEKVLQKFLNNPSYAHRDNFPGIFSFASKF